MRITTSMLAQTSKETGIPILQGGLLNALNKSGNSTDLLESLNSKKNAEKVSAMQKSVQKLGTTADELTSSASKLTADGEDSLFGKAEEKKETKDILSEVKNLVEHYNKTLELLKEADGSLNSFYCKELKAAAAESAEQLKTVGITQNTDGSLAVDEKSLDSADYDSLKAAFGSGSEFATRTEYISSKVAENADAALKSVTNQYNAKGISYSDSFESNKYNFFG